MNAIMGAAQKAFAPGLESRKYRVIILTFIFVALVYYFGVPIPESVMLRLLAVAGGYILGQGTIDAVSSYRSQPNKESSQSGH